MPCEACVKTEFGSEAFQCKQKIMSPKDLHSIPKEFLLDLQSSPTVILLDLSSSLLARNRVSQKMQLGERIIRTQLEGCPAFMSFATNQSEGYLGWTTLIPIQPHRAIHIVQAYKFANTATTDAISTI